MDNFIIIYLLNQRQLNKIKKSIDEQEIHVLTSESQSDSEKKNK